jgi:choline dehydrogenase-like flavoprotein
MLTDFRSLGDTALLQADVCVVGSGAAGIAIATSMIGTRHRVILIESGGLAFEPATQALYAGESVGLPWDFGLANSRFRVFGGTTTVWGGGCYPLDDMDFRVRPWVPHSGWPLNRADLDPWYALARRVLHTNEGPTIVEDGADEARLPYHFAKSKFVHKRGLSSLRPRLGDVYLADLERAANVHVLLHANLLELATGSAGNVSAAVVGTIEGKRARVQARHYVLACGAIENARLLLLSNSRLPAGLGNQHDLVGRFFMDHPRGRLGTITTDDPARIGDPYNRMVEVPGTPRPGDPCFSHAIQEEERLLNCRLRPQDYENDEAVPDGVKAVREFRAGIKAGAFPGGSGTLAWRIAAGLGDVVPGVVRRLANRPVVASHRIDLEGFFEQAPNPASRITLSDTPDALGQRRVRMDWQMTALDSRTFRRAAELFGSELARLGLGRLQLDPWLRDGSGGVPHLGGAAHHLGTTRMSNDPRQGVVDGNCRVHGIDNLHVVGGSVFPTGGWAFPTFTIVALALRLSAHLRQRLSA